MRNRLLLTILLSAPLLLQAAYPSLPVDILDAAGKIQGKAEIFANYMELKDSKGRKKGSIGLMKVEGEVRLFLIGTDGGRRYLGYARNHRLFDDKDVLLGFYQWTPIWSYVYDKSMNKVGRAQCLAYQGLCAAGVAGYLLGLY